MKKRFLSLILVIAISLSFSTVAYADTSKTLSITRVEQSKTLWCWAASAEMIGKYKNSNATRDQWDIVQYVFGNYDNKSANRNDFASAITYASVNASTYQSSSSPLSFASHKTNIDGNNPVGIGMKWDNSGAHAVVCAGYKVADSKEYLYIVDPGKGCDSTYFEYSKLTAGTKIKSGTGKYEFSVYKK